MSEPATLGLIAAFAAGTVSFLSPCVLPMVPAYMSYVTGQSLVEATGSQARERVGAAILSLCFVLGFSAVFIALGASATAFGRLLLRYRFETGIAGGALVTLFGLAMIAGVENIPFLRRDLRFHARVTTGSPVSAFILGLAFGFGWTPCIGPILGIILTAAAMSESVSAGIRLLGVYSAGLGLPFIVAAVFLRELARRWRIMRRAGRPLMLVAGAVMVAMGIAMATGQLTRFSYWLLESFPVLGRIG